MEWNGKYYFQYPSSRGPVYKVDLAAIGQLVTLVESVTIRIVVNKYGYIEMSEVYPDNFKESKLFEAEKIFDPADGEPTFSGKWEPFIEPINAAAAVNTLFKVKLPREVYQVLSKNEEEFDALKKRFSPRAASLLRFDDWDKNPGLFLCRTCEGCP